MRVEHVSRGDRSGGGDHGEQALADLGVLGQGRIVETGGEGAKAVGVGVGHAHAEQIERHTHDYEAG